MSTTGTDDVDAYSEVQEARDRFRPYYDSDSGQVGYVVMIGERDFRLTFRRDHRITTESEALNLEAALFPVDSDESIVYLDEVNHFE